MGVVVFACTLQDHIVEPGVTFDVGVHTDHPANGFCSTLVVDRRRPSPSDAVAWVFVRQDFLSRSSSLIFQLCGGDLHPLLRRSNHAMDLMISYCPTLHVQFRLQLDRCCSFLAFSACPIVLCLELLH
jgi:hypothetical protein